MFGNSEEKRAKKAEEDAQLAKSRERRAALNLELSELSDRGAAIVAQSEKLQALLTPELSRVAAALAPKWEYIQFKAGEAELDALGLQGWELVSATAYETGFGGQMTVNFLYVLKRPLPADKDYPPDIAKKMEVLTALADEMRTISSKMEDLRSERNSV